MTELVISKDLDITSLKKLLKEHKKITTIKTTPNNIKKLLDLNYPIELIRNFTSYNFHGALLHVYNG
ncbi:hypothetical protein OAK19_04580 [Aureispira]|nr:hypothetical protein [Aureispira sp.]